MFRIPSTGAEVAAARRGRSFAKDTRAQAAADARKVFRCAYLVMASLLLATPVAQYPEGRPLAGTPRLLAAAPATASSAVSRRQALRESATGAVPGAADGEPGLTDDTPATPEDAAAQLSGSQWPGVINHLLQRPLPDSPEDPHGADIHIDYPSVGAPAVDADIRAWVTGIADVFTAHLNLSRQSLTDAGASASDGENDADAGAAMRPAFELWGSYSISRPSDAAVSITFEIWNYTGASHGNLDILTLNYSLLTGQRLAFMDLFEKPETALELMSNWSRKELGPRLGASTRARMLEAGTAPLVENFSSLTLTPQGVCINFQPFQVAPWAAGVQKVEMPLEALLPAAPLLALWGR